MLTKKVTIYKNDLTEERLITLFNSIPMFAEMSLDWEELEEVAYGTEIEVTMQYREEDSRTVEEMLKLLTF